MCVIDNNVREGGRQREQKMYVNRAVCMSLDGGHSVFCACELSKRLYTTCNASAVCLFTKKYNHCRVTHNVNNPC